MTEIDRQIALRLKRTKPIFVDKLRKLNECIESGENTNDDDPALDEIIKKEREAEKEAEEDNDIGRH